jgi:Replication initiation factor
MILPALGPNDQGPPSNNMGVTSRTPSPWKGKSNREDDRQVTSCTFDWYQATLPGDDRQTGPQYARKVTEMLADHLKPFQSRQVDRGLSGYQRRTEFVDNRGGIELTILHGGNPKPNVKATSRHAAPFATLLRRIQPDHRVTRIDAAVDFAGSHMWGAALKTCHSVMDARGMDSGLLMQPDNPEKGATYYMGSRHSPVMARLYQKGYEQLGRFPDCGADPEWVRLELQVRPQKEAKTTFATTSADEAWGATKWSRHLIDAFSGGEWRPDGVRVAPRSETEWERTQRFMTSQYARHMFEGGKLARDNLIVPGQATNWREGLRLYFAEMQEVIASIISERIKTGDWAAADRKAYDVHGPAILGWEASL